jgi:hypothetical protein
VRIGSPRSPLPSTSDRSSNKKRGRLFSTRATILTVGGIIGIILLIVGPKLLSGDSDTTTTTTTVVGGGTDNGDGDNQGNAGGGTPDGGVEDPVVESVTVTVSGCDITVEWDVTGDNGSLDLVLNGEVVEDELPVEDDARQGSASSEGSFEVIYEVVARDSAGNETNRMSDSNTVTCIL